MRLALVVGGSVVAFSVMLSPDPPIAGVASGIRRVRWQDEWCDSTGWTPVKRPRRGQRAWMGTRSSHESVDPG